MLFRVAPSGQTVSRDSAAPLCFQLPQPSRVVVDCLTFIFLATNADLVTVPSIMHRHDISPIPRYTRIIRHLVDIGVLAEKEVIQ